MENTQNLQATKDELRAAIETHLQPLSPLITTASKRQIKAATEELRSEVNKVFKAQEQANEKHLKAVASFETTLHNLRTHIDNLNEECAKEATIQSILRSLDFPSRQNRYGDIAEAYPETFTWIFESDKTPFKDWLEKDSGVFWVNGKAGSGKSTLMKYLNTHDQTPEILREWAANQGKELHTASFYFWNSGTVEQNTQEGLLKSLLFQILCKCPHLTKFASERRWNADAMFHMQPDKWLYSELTKAFQNIISQGTDKFSTCFCFFIDGLDEYAGDHDNLIETLDSIAALGSVKLCVSSRPWTAFQERYGKDHLKKFVLQQLTETDMDKFVREQLEEDRRWELLAKDEPKADYFITKIRERADGVFLWVFLVVKSLLRGLQGRDGFEELERRLNELPQDLDEFFRHMLDRIEPIYRDYMAKTLLLAVKSKSFAFPQEAVYYLLSEDKDPDFALGAEIGELTEHQRREIEQQSRWRLSKWCKDLLEIKSALPHGSNQAAWARQVGFLHRTVRDFLLTPDIQTQLTKSAGAGYSPWLWLVRVHLRRAKAADHTTGNRVRQFIAMASECLDCAREYQKDTPAALAPSEQLLELDRVGKIIYEDAYKGSSHWSTIFGGLHPSHLSGVLEIPQSPDFLALAMSFNLEVFITKQIKTKQKALETSRGDWPILNFALHDFFTQTRDEPNSVPSLPLVELLLKAGANPNERNPVDPPEPRSRLEKQSVRQPNYSVWTLFLLRCQEDPHAALWPIAKMMIDHGAALDTEIDASYVVTKRKRKKAIAQQQGEPEIYTVRQCLKASFEKAGYEESELELFVPNASSKAGGWQSRVAIPISGVVGFLKVRIPINTFT